MNWLEIALLVFGTGAFVGSFLIKEKTRDSEGGQQVDPELIRSVIEKEMDDAKERVTEVIDETLEYAVEKTERASERISNEKIMAISEYSETVLADINKSHQEVMFLYDMLNDKHNNLKETIKHIDKTAKEAEEAANAAAIALAVKAKETAEIKERERQETEKKNKLMEVMPLDKDAQEKEYARRQMARLILPMQQEGAMHRQVDARALDMASWAPNIGNRAPGNKPAELSPLVVKSVEIVTSKDMQPIPESSTSVGPVSMVDLQALGTRPEDMKVVDVKPADIRTVEVYSFAEQAPHIERPVKKEIQAASLENPVGAAKQQEVHVSQLPATVNENSNDKILRLHKEGYSEVEIAKQLGLGVGEVKLVINLFKGAV